MNIINQFFSRIAPKIPADIDTTESERTRGIVTRLARGNVRLQFGMYETEQSLALRKERILKHDFI